MQPSKILVINLMHIGDLLLVTPILRTLRTQFPQAHIALLADKKLQDVVKNNQNINELITIDKKGKTMVYSRTCVLPGSCGSAALTG